VRVLVVDDQPDVLATTMELFKLMGYEVFSASNGQEAMAILESTPDIQVLFSDVVMPGMNGFKLGMEARRLIPGINVILASGYQGEAVGAGPNRDDFHFLVKPFRMADVARMLRK
jgi:DNA-binding NtrC family response regulator